MKRMRQAHLWIGLITSIFLLMEAVTGLLLAEPWLIGQQERGAHREFLSPNSLAPEHFDNFQEGRQMREAVGQALSLAGIIRGLHEGRLGSFNVKWAIDIAAVAIILLTLSGIYLSLRLLVAQRHRKRKRSLPVATE
ncbi:hypothetical protein H839_01076 [Parageobacillus genomosp. 1]|uniref:PepSY-associated TM helix domain-containing protein n=2 Tax=Parageobacillus genomosp. 1 TaxID=1295642 RepID=A0ABC9VI30_9BACL|nr:PepSY-associated TM helix domain-containing protein [Parageobacillus genomosp. 1]EZP78417.1 hypothetical protein H839_01076 [Parageobacillus genomosp. 1]